MTCCCIFRCATRTRPGARHCRNWWPANWWWWKAWLSIPRRSFGRAGSLWHCCGRDDDGNNNFAPRLTLRHFNFYPNITQALKPGAPARVFGEVRDGRYGLEMVHPVFKKADDVAEGGAADEGDSGEKARAGTTPQPILSSAGVPQAALRTLAGKALRVVDWQRDLLPRDITATAGLPGWRETPRPCICRPTASAPASWRTSHPPGGASGFDELLAQQMALRDAKALPRNTQRRCARRACCPPCCGSGCRFS